ncbi:MAG: hypothetical protein EZS28_000781 [Streblomastix strix]|uniref:TmcB/TmcC TPR repeats domain-containing protein n=1 Tax=Streblomastix strix TaxID=222440 RepID=A0A5J4XB17_9EUKA|nr:MAG: hypothetical protein EZS28_000781 [Streblomastix strix]
MPSGNLKRPNIKWQITNFVLKCIFLLSLSTYWINPVTFVQSTLSKIGAIDCYKPIPDQKSIITSGTDECFGSSVLQLVSAIVSIAVNLPFILIIATGSSFPTHNRHSKKGGIFSIKQGQIIAFDRFLLFGVVFAMRFLFDWPFWRFFVTVGTSSLLVFIYTVIQPYYHIIGNYLSALPYLLFGLIRAFAELAYFASGASKNETNIITFSLLWAIGLVCAGVASVFLFFIIRKIEQKHWCLNKDGSPLVSISAIYSAAMEQKTSSLGDKVKMYLQDQDSTQETQSKHDQRCKIAKPHFILRLNIYCLQRAQGITQYEGDAFDVPRKPNEIILDDGQSGIGIEKEMDVIVYTTGIDNPLKGSDEQNKNNRRLSTFDETEIPGTLMRMHNPVDLNKEYENMTLTRSKAKMAKFGQMFTPVQINQASNPNNPDILPLIEEESTTKDQNSNTLQDPHKFNVQKQGENKIKKKWGSLVGIVNNLKRKESSTNQIEKNPSLLLSAQSSDKTKDEGKREQDDEEEIQSPQSQSQKGTYLKHAIELHNLSITALKEFWRMASENVVNFKHLGKSVERLQQQERAALHEYEEQMSTHPQDQNLYILFSTFFRQIFNDQELADEFEVQSIQIYEFGFDTDNKKVISQASMRVNLITALNQLVNRCKTLGSSTSPQIDLPTYRQDLLYIVFNTLLPVMESAKKAVVNCLLTTQELARYAPINSIAIVLTGAGVAIIGLLLLYGYSIFQMFSKSRSAFRRAAISRHDSMLMNLKAMEDIHPVNEQTIEEITKKLNEFVKNQEIAADITKQETAKDTQQGNAESLLQDHDLDTNKQLFIPTNRLGQVNKKLTLKESGYFRSNYFTISVEA